MDSFEYILQIFWVLSFWFGFFLLARDYGTSPGKKLPHAGAKKHPETQPSQCRYAKTQYRFAVTSGSPSMPN